MPHPYFFACSIVNLYTLNLQRLNEVTPRIIENLVVLY